MSTELIERIKRRKSASHGAGNDLVFAECSMQGWRNEMEDAHCAFTRDSGIKGWSFFAIFDGHGGEWCSKQAAKELWTAICNDIYSKIDMSPEGTINWTTFETRISALKETDIIDAIKKGFINLDNKLRKSIDKDDKSGTTVVAALLTKEFIFLINCGDSRGIFVRDNTLELATFDHKPTQLKEKQRIQNAGGLIALSRVNGGLATSRGIGDFEYKDNKDLDPYHQFVSCEPDVYVINRTEQDNFIVLACDGIWDVKKNEDVQEFIFKKLGKENVDGNRLQNIATELVDSSFDSGSKDNMSVILIYFNHPRTSSNNKDEQAHVSRDNKSRVENKASPQPLSSSPTKVNTDLKSNPHSSGDPSSINRSLKGFPTTTTNNDKQDSDKVFSQSFNGSVPKQKSPGGKT